MSCQVSAVVKNHMFSQKAHKLQQSLDDALEAFYQLDFVQRLLVEKHGTDQTQYPRSIHSTIVDCQQKTERLAKAINCAILASEAAQKDPSIDLQELAAVKSLKRLANADDALLELLSGDARTISSRADDADTSGEKPLGEEALLASSNVATSRSQPAQGDIDNKEKSTGNVAEKGEKANERGVKTKEEEKEHKGGIPEKEHKRGIPEKDQKKDRVVVNRKAEVENETKTKPEGSDRQGTVPAPASDDTIGNLMSALAQAGKLDVTGTTHNAQSEAAERENEKDISDIGPLQTSADLSDALSALAVVSEPQLGQSSSLSDGNARGSQKSSGAGQDLADLLTSLGEADTSQPTKQAFQKEEVPKTDTAPNEVNDLLAALGQLDLSENRSTNDTSSEVDLSSLLGSLGQSQSLSDDVPSGVPQGDGGGGGGGADHTNSGRGIMRALQDIQLAGDATSPSKSNGEDLLSAQESIMSFFGGDEKPRKEKTEVDDASVGYDYDDLMANLRGKSNRPSGSGSCGPHSGLIRDIGVREDINKAGMRRIKKKSVQFSKKGRRGKPVYAMEDTNYAACPFNENDNWGLFCVFDGHVDKDAAVAAKSLVPKDWAKKLDAAGEKEDYKAELRQLFLDVDEQMIDNDISGTTATVVFMWKVGDRRFVQSANVGDSTAFLCRNGTSVALSKDHKLSSKEERDRLKEAGMTLYEGQSRINGLAVCRALGDHFVKQTSGGLTPEPFVSDAVQLNESDSKLIVASDGLWDIVSGQEACDIIADMDMRDATPMAAKLLQTAVSSPHCTDNVTVVVATL